MDLYKECTLCPRNCRVNRRQTTGYCGAGTETGVASVCLHRGEEPVLGGGEVCNIFFSRCNLDCGFCQNAQISRRTGNVTELTFEETIGQIRSILRSGVDTLGFVSPTHRIPAMLKILDAVRKAGFSPTVIHNSNGYDAPDVLRDLEGMVDIYLPDCKYADEQLAVKYSGAPDYPGASLRALREMFRQKGRRLRIDENGIARSGVIVRHLILPGAVENSIRVLETLAEEFGTGIAVSLMTQYYPPAGMRPGIPDRTLNTEEIEAVREAYLSLGFTNGWIQEAESSGHYRPDFDREHPFL